MAKKVTKKTGKSAGKRGAGSVGERAGGVSERSAPGLSPAERARLLDVLAERFGGNMERHAGVLWADVRVRLEQDAFAVWKLAAMERSGGEPDLVGAGDGGALLFVDCSPESPAGRRSLCYDREALDARKEAKPAGSAVEAAAAMGAELLDEAQYRALQSVGEFDRKTSSWIRTPEAIRSQGGALFCDRRYGHVFTYHNGAQSYYAARGFRVCVRV